MRIIASVVARTFPEEHLSDVLRKLEGQRNDYTA